MKQKNNVSSLESSFLCQINGYSLSQQQECADPFGLGSRSLGNI